MPLQLLQKTVKDFLDDDCPMMAAALSYYTVFSLPPLLILLLVMVGAFVGVDRVQEALSSQLGNLMGPGAQQGVLTIFTEAKRPDVNRGLASFIGVVALIAGATGVVGQLQAALNKAWEVKPDPEQGGVKNFIGKRILSIGMILGLAFLLLVSLVVSAAISAFGTALGRMVPGLGEPLLHVLNFAISLAIFMLLFATMFKVLPDAVIEWRDVWVGAAVTSVLFGIGKFAIGLYLGRSDPGQAYGAAGSLAIMLVWIYYAAMILLLGAEFTQSWAGRRNGGIRPEPGAVRVEQETRLVRASARKK
jgi:membrane protein